MNPDAALSGLVLSIAALVLIWSGERARRASAVLKMLGALAPRRVGRPERRAKRPILTGAEVGALCSEVAARLRAGEPSERAWNRSLARLWAASVRREHGGRAIPWLKPLGGTRQRPGWALLTFWKGRPAEAAAREPRSGLDFLAGSGEAGQTVLLGVRFSDATGAPLAEVLERCADALAESERVREARKVAFAGPRASANVLGTLPLVGVGGAQFLGASPFEWFLSGLPQFLLLIVGVALALAGRLVSRGMLRSAERAGSLEARAPVLCDLAISALRSGQSVPSVLRALGRAEAEESSSALHQRGPVRGLANVAAELELGATWSEAWSPLPAGGALLDQALEPAWVDGVSPIPLLKGAAEHARASAVSEARQAAERLAVRLAFPLGMLLLPAFVILGLLPIFFSLLAAQFGGLSG